MNYLRAHVTELNRRQAALMESSERGFPTHMNLETRHKLPQHDDDEVNWLKRQNKQLTQVSHSIDNMTSTHVILTLVQSHLFYRVRLRSNFPISGAQ
jgi:hypothetical protein